MKLLRQHAAVKSITGIVLMLVVFSLVVGAIGYNGFTDALLTQYSDGAFLTAEAALQLLDPDRIDDYALSGGETVEYKTVWTQLDHLCNSAGVTFIYVIQPDLTDYAHITFLFSTINHDSPYSVYDFGYYRQTTNDEYREKYRALYEQTAEKELVIRDKGYIETDPHITAMVGVKDTEGKVCAILCVQRQMDTLARVRRGYVHKVAMVLVVLALLVIVGQSLFLHGTLLQPLKQISEEAIRFSTENVMPEKKLAETVRNEDEIGALAASIDAMEEQIQLYVENLTKITAEKERISTELSLAARIQEAMLPQTFPPFPDRREFALYASMDPAKEVGGDFYDFFLIDEEHLCLTIADVSGKGIPAALVMMICKTILQSCAMLGRSPADILAKTNEAICSKNREDMFITVWIGILEISTGRLTAGNAGHEYPAIRRADGRFELLKDEHDLPIGAFDGMSFGEYTLQLNPGDSLFVYTDGVPEATDIREAAFGTDRMLTALNRDPAADPETMLRNVRQDLDAFVGNAEQFDDITMLGFVYHGPEGTEQKEA